MAKKGKTVFVCNECGSESSKWVGQCPVCGAWNTMFEQKVPDFAEDDKRRRTSGGTAGDGRPAKAGKPERLAEVKSSETARRAGNRQINHHTTGGAAHSPVEWRSSLRFRRGIRGTDQDEG